MEISTGLISLEVVARVNRIQIDLRSMVKELALAQVEPDINELLRLSSRCGFRARHKKLRIAVLVKKYPLPAIIIYSDGTYGVLLQAAGENKLLVFSPMKRTPEEISYADFESLGVKEFIILAYKEKNAQIKFGLKWFWVEIIKYKHMLWEIMAASFVVQLLGLITPLFTQIILDKVIVHNSLGTLYVLSVAFIAFMIFEFMLNVARNYVFNHTASKIDAKLGAKLFKHLFALPFVYFESRKVGNIISRIRELDRIREFVTNKLVSVIIDTLFSVVFVVVMLLYSVKLTLIVLAFIAAISVLYLAITPELRRRLEEKFFMSSESNSYLVESVTGIQTVKSLAVESTMQKNWENKLAGYINSSFKLSSMSNLSGAFSGMLQKGMTIAVLFIGVELVITKQLTIGQLIAFQMISRQLTSPILRLVTLWNEFQQVLIAVDKLGDILNHPTEQSSDTAITLPSLQGSIRLDNVAFRYKPGSPLVLSNINLSISPGTSIGLVGRSGSGKSTVAKLLQKLYIVDDGSIFVDDIDIKHINPIWLRNNIGVVLQENYLFSGSIKENIVLTRPDAPMEDIVNAARLAGAHEFISQLPEGYDTMVGERGSTLSGGQKQRVAIARALISDPKIIIFDEATSALDYESERIIKENMASIKAGRTLVIIAHRLSTIKDCDLMRKARSSSRGRMLS